MINQKSGVEKKDQEPYIKGYQETISRLKKAKELQEQKKAIVEKWVLYRVTIIVLGERRSTTLATRRE